MKPNFALSLSFDGIRMLHRASAGWHLIGEVSLEAADLGAELAVLRRTAMALNPRGLRTKLLLPNEQIRYLALDTTRAQDEDVRAALDGATPYAVADLAYDYSRGGGRTYIAAVARETLAEAEAFATEHKMNPVCFAAVPEPFTYMGEVFFGPTEAAATLLAAGEMPERDDAPVEVVGRADLPELSEPAAAPEAETAAAPVIVPAVSNAGPPPELQPIPQPQDPGIAPPAPKVVAVPAAEPAPAPVGPEATPEPAPARVPEPEPEPELAPEPAPEPDPPVVFTSRVRSGGEDGATRPPHPAPEAPLPRLDPPSPEAEASEPIPVPTFRRSVDNDAPRTEPPRLAVPVTADPAGPPLSGARRDDDAASAPELPPLRAPTPDREPSPLQGAAPTIGAVHTDVADLASEPAPELAPELTIAPGDSLDPVSVPDPDPDMVTPALEPAGEPAKGGGFFSRRKARPDPKPDAPAPPGTKTADEARQMTVFGARKAASEGPSVGGKPRYLGLILTLILLLFMAAVAAMAAISEDGFSVWFGGGETPGEPEIAAAEASASASGAGPGPDIATLATTAPAPPTEETGGALGAITEAVAAASAPVAPDAPESATADPAPDLPETAAADTSRLRAAGGAPIGRILTPAEAERIYAATGVWQRAPRVQIVPRPLTLEGLQRARLDTGVAAQTPSTLPEGDPLAQDLAFIAPTDPPPPDLRFERDANGFVIATEEGAETPEGAIVFAGSPEILPPARPGSVTAAAEALAEAPAPGTAEQSPQTAPRLPELALAPPPARPAPEATPRAGAADAEAASPEASDAVSPGGVALAAFRPAPRPGDLDAAAPAAEAPADPDVVGVRPAARPQDLAPPEPEQETTGPDPEEVDPFATATDYAVSLSPNPETRPRNFARVVDRARAQQERQQAAAAAAQASEPQSQPARAVAPSGPTATTVAQAATRTNAINLRQLNLIGVYGSPGDRRALVRLGNGRYVKVGVGDRLDGGQVAAIGDSALRYVKRGRNIVLEIPNG